MELNDQVTVKLTEVGAKILNDRVIKIQQLCPTLNWNVEYKANDFYTDQLWSLFNVFGENCCIGSEIVFTNLELSK